MAVPACALCRPAVHRIGPPHQRPSGPTTMSQFAKSGGACLAALCNAFWSRTWAPLTTRTAPTIAVSLDDFVEPVVIKRAGHGSELFAELPGGGGEHVSLVRRLVLPNFGDGEMVCPVALLPHFKALGIGLLAAVVGELVEQGDRWILEGAG